MFRFSPQCARLSMQSCLSFLLLLLLLLLLLRESFKSFTERGGVGCKD